MLAEDSNQIDSSQATGKATPKNSCSKKIFKQIIKHMQDNKTRARMDLLGEQWFMGRTGEKNTS